MRLWWPGNQPGKQLEGQSMLTKLAEPDEKQVAPQAKYLYSIM